LVNGVAEAAVAGVAGEHDRLAAAGAGDRERAGVFPAACGVGVAVWVVSELGEHPCAQHRPAPGLTGVSLGVRVSAKPSATTSSRAGICSITSASSRIWEATIAA
jgi:hypothetical protein